MHGVIVKKDGTIVNVVIGEDDNDPVLGISDLLVHLSQEQMQKTAAKVIDGEDLNIIIGSMPLKDEEKEAVKANAMKLIADRYGIFSRLSLRSFPQARRGISALTAA